MRLVIIFLSLSTLIGCKHLSFWGSAEDEKNKGEAVDQSNQEPAKKNIKSVSMEELELKLAKVWTRLDELEEKNLRLKEKLKIIEKGLLLGITPEELKDEEPMAEDSLEGNKNLLKKGTVKNEETGEKEKIKSVEPLVVKEDEKIKEFKIRLAAADDYYKAGQYGRSIVEYSSIGKDFGGEITEGVHLYWQGLCWANLKEYGSARQYLLDFIAEYASSPLTAKAKVDLAKVEIKLGLKETAFKRLKEVIEKHPYEDAAGLARNEIEKLEKAL